MRLLRRRGRGLGADDRPPVRRGQDALQEGQRDEGLAEHQHLLAAPRRLRAELEQPDYFGAAPDQICGASPITTNSSSSSSSALRLCLTFRRTHGGRLHRRRQRRRRRRRRRRRLRRWRRKSKVSEPVSPGVSDRLLRLLRLAAFATALRATEVRDIGVIPDAQELLISAKERSRRDAAL